MTRVKCQYDAATRLTPVRCGVSTAVSRAPTRYWRTQCRARGAACCQCAASARSNCAVNSAEVSLFIAPHVLALRVFIAEWECGACDNQGKVNSTASISTLHIYSIINFLVIIRALLRINTYSQLSLHDKGQSTLYTRCRNFFNLSSIAGTSTTLIGPFNEEVIVIDNLRFEINHKLFLLGSGPDLVLLCYEIFWRPLQSASVVCCVAQIFWD